jgi:hypothetical protein
MRNYLYSRILALLILSALLNLQCSCSTRTSLRLRVRPRSAPVSSTPPPRVTVHLLDIDPIDGEVYNADPKLKELAGLMNARRQEAYSLGPDVFLFLDQSRPIWEPHVIRSVETDGQGNARLDDLKPGRYWLMAYSQAQVRDAFWAQQLTVKEGDNEVVLEPGNALYFMLNGALRQVAAPPI